MNIFFHIPLNKVWRQGIQCNFFCFSRTNHLIASLSHTWTAIAFSKQFSELKHCTQKLRYINSLKMIWLGTPCISFIWLVDWSDSACRLITDLYLFRHASNKASQSYLWVQDQIDKEWWAMVNNEDNCTSRKGSWRRNQQKCEDSSTQLREEKGCRGYK